MNQETQKMLQQLADKLGVTVQYLWATLVKGNRVEGAILFGFVGLGIVGGICAFFLLRQGFRELKNNSYDEDAYFWGGGILALVAGGMSIGCAYWAIMDTFCPEYGALADILGHVK